MLKRKFAVASPARKPRKSARKRITKGQVRTNVVIDRELAEKAKAKARVRTARAAIHVALENYVKPYDYSGILETRGHRLSRGRLRRLQDRITPEVPRLGSGVQARLIRTTRV